MSSDCFAQAPTSGDALLRPTRLQFPSLVVFSPRLRDFTDSPTPNGLEVVVDGDHGGVIFEVPADNPQRGGNYRGKGVRRVL